MDEIKEELNNENQSDGKSVKADRTLWVIVILMSVLAIVVGVCSSILTGYFMRRGVTPPTINSESTYEQITAVVSTRKKCICEVATGLGYTTRGSGVIMKLENNKIYIMTNNHVLNGSDMVRVRFDGEDSYSTAEVIGYESYYDVAVIAVDSSAAPYTVYELDGSDSFLPNLQYAEGDVVVAIGNAMGYGIASYDGIISRSYELIDHTDDYGTAKTVPVLRTTAAINAGMSGGALFDSNGNFVGLSTYRLAVTNNGESVADTSFVTPVSIVYPVYQQIMRYKVGNNDIGLSSTMQAFRCNDSAIGGITFYFNGYGGFTAKYVKGKLTVASLDLGTPAKGLKEGDVIVSIGSQGNMQEVSSDICKTMGNVLNYKYNGTGGSALVIEYMRDGITSSVTVDNYYRVV